MASVPPSYPLSSSPLPPPPPLPQSSETSSSFRPSPQPPTKETQCNVTTENSVFTPSSHPPAFSVETRICPVKHGIAVSLCLVDTTAASSSRLDRVKDSETELKSIGWVSTNTWDSRITGADLDTATRTTATSSKGSPISTKTCIDANKILILSENKGQDKHKVTSLQDTSRGGSATQAAAEGDYIDILQATMLFGNAKSVTEEQHKLEVERQPQAQMQQYPQRQTQMQPQAQRDSYRQAQRQANTQAPPQGQSQAHMQLTTKPQTHSPPRSEAIVPLTTNISTAGPQPAHRHSQSHQTDPDSLEASQCVRTVRFSEKPCTPCMTRRQGGKVSMDQEMRCRHRDSYQAAIQNPVAFGREKERGNMLAVLVEDGDFSELNDGQRPPGTDRDPWCDPGIANMSPLSGSGSICVESGEKNSVPYWNWRDSNTEQASEKIAVPFRESGDQHCAKPYGNLHSVNVKNPAGGMRINTNKDLSSSNHPKQSDVMSAKHSGLPFSLSEISGMSMTLKPHESLQNRTKEISPNLSKSLPQSIRESTSDGRCSSLSTAVVATSEKCEVIIVEGQNIRRRENTDSCSSADLPQLRVVKCKNSTAFGLVSPKVSRWKFAVPKMFQFSSDGAQQGSKSVTCRNDYQTAKQSHADPPTAADSKKISQPVSARPRPDHLPLGSPDPSAHPLYLGVASLTGGRDRTNRAIVEIYGDHQGWRSAVTSQELLQMLLYFHSITRREIREAGMTLIFDARKMNPQPQLYKALMTLQEQNPHAVRCLVLLVDKDSSHKPERCPGVQTDVATSMKALLKLVEGSQLSPRLDGTHNHCDWMELHQKLFPFVCDLHEASSLLLRAISRLEEPQRTDAVQTVQQCMMDQRTLMRDVLEDSKLVSLQRGGGALLARLRKESDLKYPHCEDFSDAVDSVTSLYNHVEEQAHFLVQRSNLSLEHLNYLLQLREMEGHLTQMQQWLNIEGERHLLEAESVEHSGDKLEQILNSFTAFLLEASDRKHHAISLVSEAERLWQSGLTYPETETFRTFVLTFKSGLEDFLCRVEDCGRELQIMVNICDFCEQAVALASECIDYLEQSQLNIQQVQQQQQNQDPGPSAASLYLSEIAHSSSPTSTSSDTAILQTFKDRFLQFNAEKFQEVKVQASDLRGSRGMRVWNVAWLKCQEARQQLQERMRDEDVVHHQKADSGSSRECHYVDVVSTNIQAAAPGSQSLVVQSTPGPRHPQWRDIMSGAVDLEKRRPILGNTTTSSTNIACCNIKAEDHSDAGKSQESKVTSQSPHRSAKRTERGAQRRQASRSRSERDAAALSQSHTIGCQWFPWGRGLRTRSVSQDSCATGAAMAGPSTPPEQRVRSPSSCSHHGQPSCRILKEAQKFQISRHSSFCSEDSCTSDQCAAGGHGNLCCKHCSLPVGKYEGAFGPANPQESGNNALRLQCVLEELVFTEKEYVRSLGYILTHYLPLLDRPDTPPHLRGKRGVVFGNLEKLYDFHSHYFLPELEACQREPAMVARCFLRHSESFGLYALYSKNKPQSDTLILHRRHDIFKKKQQELGDMMDLSSYLLRPIQRISKYSLLLQDMLSLAGSYRPKGQIQDTPGGGVCVPGVHVPDLSSCERGREIAEIRAAADLVQFQMRHGNDLLTMDAIQDCDVNLKEQGQLIRQDEFIVFFRKKKCVRRVFLFEDLILFSKTKRTDVGNDFYVYKQSFKTSDIGMTHNSSMSGLCFEIWFRRRKSEDTYTLKASSMEVKKSWTTDLEKILWDQATHSRELCMQERVFMGMGYKPYMDIQPSDAAICDRAVSCALPGRIPVACCSHRSVDYTRPHSIGSGSTASTTLSQSSSSSGRGSLPPAGYPGNHSQGAETGPAACSFNEAVTDNELNNHRLHRNCEQWKAHHPLTDSTESSGEGINFFSGSECSCLSAIGGEVVDSSSSLISHSSKPRSPLNQTPSQRRNSSPATIKRKPRAASRPPHLAHAQSDDIINAKSTEI